MNRRAFTVSSLLAVPAITNALGLDQRSPAGSPIQSHEAWVLSTIEQMNTVRVGMTRADLLKFFQEQGGLSMPTQQTFVSRACMYFKVDVEFTVANERGHGAGDVIARISRPYLDKRVIID